MRPLPVFSCSELVKKIKVIFFKQGLGRILRGVKNRYGATDEIGVFAMTERGLEQVSQKKKKKKKKMCPKFFYQNNYNFF